MKRTILHNALIFRMTIFMTSSKLKPTLISSALFLHQVFPRWILLAFLRNFWKQLKSLIESVSDDFLTSALLSAPI